MKTETLRTVKRHPDLIGSAPLYWSVFISKRQGWVGVFQIPCPRLSRGRKVQRPNPALSFYLNKTVFDLKELLYYGEVNT